MGDLAAVHAALTERSGEGWVQIGQLAVAFGLSAIIGLERELKHRAAGVRTYTVVGLGAALFMVISKYGFFDVLGPNVVVDPSRVAAQIVSGLGFIGGGIIFVRRGSVRGLTTAASVWLTAAVGAAAGAGLEVIAVAGTVAYFLTILLLPFLARLVARRVVSPWPTLGVRYLDGHGLLRDVLAVVTQFGFAVANMRTAQRGRRVRGAPELTVEAGLDRVEEASVEVKVLLSGRGDLEGLVIALSEMDGVLQVFTATDDGADE